MSLTENTKPIKISWVTPSGKNYEDTIPMTLDQYVNFVTYLRDLKQKKSELVK